MLTSREVTLLAKAGASAKALGVPVFVSLPGGLHMTLTP